MGLVVFLAMVNDAAAGAPNRWKYVGDVTVGESCSPNASPSRGTQRAMDSICLCADNNHMSLNVAKCGVMQCSLSRKPPPPLRVTAHGQTDPTLPSMTLLGVTLLPLLKWDQHIKTITSKANGRIYFLVVLKRVSSQNILLLFCGIAQLFAIPAFFSS